MSEGLCQRAHHEAMQFADLADQALREGDEDAAFCHFASAYERELEAATCLIAAWIEEPSRSVLYRSAATLACEAHQWRDAELAACQGLRGNAPPEIAEELREVLRRAWAGMKGPTDASKT